MIFLPLRGTPIGEVGIYNTTRGTRGRGSFFEKGLNLSEPFFLFPSSSCGLSYFLLPAYHPPLLFALLPFLGSGGLSRARLHTKAEIKNFNRRSMDQMTLPCCSDGLRRKKAKLCKRKIGSNQSRKLGSFSSLSLAIAYRTWLNDLSKSFD